MEYDHMAELGLMEETQFICSDHGFMTRSNPIKDLCARFVSNGGRFYEVMSRYEDILVFALGKDNVDPGSVNIWMVPFLKAGGVTDESAHSFCKASLQMMPDAGTVFRYIQSQMPAFISSGSYEHHLMGMADEEGIPLTNVSCNTFSFDSIKVSRPDAKVLRSIVDSTTSTRLQDEMYSVTQSEYLNKYDSKLVDALDDRFMKVVSKMEFYPDLKKHVTIAGNEKAYSVLELCRKKEIQVSSTIIVGGDNSDYPAMDLVRDSNGLSISFIGSEYAVRGSNVAILDGHPITVAVLSMEFYNGGIESVYDMIEHWSVEDLRRRPCADRNLMNRFLVQFQNGLPEVHRVDESNRKEITIRSNSLRKRILV